MRGFKFLFVLILLLGIIANIFSQKKGSIKFNGSYECIVDLAHTKTFNRDTDYGEFNWGVNNFLNLRLNSEINENLSFGFAININTFSGSFTNFYDYFFPDSLFVQAGDSSTDKSALLNKKGLIKLVSLPFYYKSAYVGSFELERLYFKAGNEYFDIETGLIRIASGQKESMFSPIDFFNPKNPLNPTARPEPRLAILASFYPARLFNIQTFIVAPDDPLQSKGWDFKFGTKAKFFFKKINFELLYAFFLPQIEYEKDPASIGLQESTNNDFSHIVAVSFKADIEIGLFFDILYKFEHKSFKSGKYYGKNFYGYEGLEASIGVDYTLPGGWVYLKLEYLFYGSGMLDWWDSIDQIYVSSEWKYTNPYNRIQLLKSEKKSLNFLRHDYISGLINVKVNDYLRLGTSYLFGIDDQSGLLTIFGEIEPFQAFNISIQAMFPFDWSMINKDWQIGEFSGANLGYYHRWLLICRVKF
ncbi:MAG TPA: hypothetical protein PLE45_08290 [Spirochaetota bacterium]|nr:hypothetical protein [Spirochaetota bacterium]HOL57923.1 hypothetical protein [Spirochaetota bacterium]HPP04767.1 hypothetical protein [Spirochaetota bacterium]